MGEYTIALYFNRLRSRIGRVGHGVGTYTPDSPL